ncbi:MAG TPA: BTAD domain-containing putative transcriptional regulator [Pseudonocardiaceae bacterium]|jgi:DNA-binding SARP family transcriptional activator/uncharacterized protein YoaH (UPF0181 family)
MGEGFRFGLLGPLSVTWDGVPVTVGAAQQRVVLATLLVDANRVVTVDALIAALWADTPPRGARNDLQNVMSRLRRTLGGVQRQALVETHPGGYRVELAEDALDISRFRDLAQQARDAGDDPERAAPLLRSALALWRGDALADVPSELLRRDIVPSWEDQRLAALELCLDGELRLGRHDEVTAELRELTDQHPLRERFWAQRMLALYRSGRPAEALDCYRAVSTLLAEELGADPGTSLRELHVRILRSDPTLDPAPVRQQSTARVAVPVPHQLPLPIADFTDRDEELAGLRAALTARSASGVGPRVATITGAGGVGKTTLAVRLAHQVIAEYPDGQLFVDLRGAGQRPVTADEALGLFLLSLGLAGTAIPCGGQERATLYRSLLAERRMLIVLDNATDDAHIRPLLPGAAGCGVVVTSRARLSGAAGTLPVELGVFSDGAAMRFLGQAIGATRVAAEPEAAVSLVQLCGGLPLALRIVAARLVTKPHWRLADLGNRMVADRGPLHELTHGDLDVRSSLALSYAGLTPAAQRLMRRIGLLDSPDIPTWAAAALADVDLGQAEELLEQLVDARLMEPRGPDRLRHRYHCHDLIHAYARERALAEESPEDRLGALTRAFGGWLSLAEHAQYSRWGGEIPLHGKAIRWWPTGWSEYAGYDTPLACLADEQTALSATIEQVADLGLDELCWELAWHSVSLYESHGCFDQWLHACGEALMACEKAGNVRGMAAMLRTLADRFCQLGAHDDARWLAEESARLFADAGDDIGAALAHETLAFIDVRTGQPARALAEFTRILTLFGEAGVPCLEVNALCGVAHAHVELHDYPAAAAGLERAREILDEIGGPRGQGQVLYGLGVLNLRRGDHEQAQQAFERLQLLARRTGVYYGEAIALVGLGEALAAQRTTQRAEDSLQRARVMARNVGDRLLEGRALLGLGGLDITRNRTTAAATNLNLSVAIFEQLQATHWHRRATDALNTLGTPVSQS